MDSMLYWTNVAAGLSALVSVLWFLGRMAAGAARSRRSGVAKVTVLAHITTGTIGLGLILAAAFTGGKAALWLLRLLGFPNPVLVVLGQLALGFLASWLIAEAFYRWLNAPLRAWFAGEEASPDG